MISADQKVCFWQKLKLGDNIQYVQKVWNIHMLNIIWENLMTLLIRQDFSYDDKFETKKLT